jgi:hypothetical protein
MRAENLIQPFFAVQRKYEIPRLLSQFQNRLNLPKSLKKIQFPAKKKESKS